MFKVIVKLDYLTDVFFNLLNSHELLLNFYNKDIHQNNPKLKNQLDDIDFFPKNRIYETCC